MLASDEKGACGHNDKPRRVAVGVNIFTIYNKVRKRKMEKR